MPFGIDPSPGFKEGGPDRSEHLTAEMDLCRALRSESTLTLTGKADPLTGQGRNSVKWLREARLALSL